jgi:hypothetical protein
VGVIPVMRTWVAGELVTAAYMNTNVRDAGNFLIATPTFQARQNLAQAIANLTNTQVLLDTEIVDSDSAHNLVTNTSRYIPQTPGYYQMGGGTGWVSNNTGFRAAFWAFNGAIVLGSGCQFNAATGVATAVPARTKIMGFNGTTDYAELFGAQSSGGSLNTSVGGTEASDFSGHWLRT